MQDETLMIQFTGEPKYPVYPESETSFFYKVIDAQITFEKDGEGNIEALILHIGGEEHTAKRIE